MIPNERSYKGIMLLNTFDERFEYLRLSGAVGRSTFGFDRHLNQSLYRSREWRDIRHAVITRDEGCDLGMLDRPIYGRLSIHHINPISINDIKHGAEAVFDMDNLICVAFDTHNAIHYGVQLPLLDLPAERSRGDMLPWR